MHSNALVAVTHCKCITVHQSDVIEDQVRTSAGRWTGGGADRCVSAWSSAPCSLPHYPNTPRDSLCCPSMTGLETMHTSNELTETNQSMEVHTVALVVTSSCTGTEVVRVGFYKIKVVPGHGTHSVQTQVMKLQSILDLKGKKEKGIFNFDPLLVGS